MIDRDVAIGDLRLRSGDVLGNVVQRVTLYGTPNAAGDNVVLVPHALTGSSRVVDWWAPIAGPGGLFDPERFCLVGINALGGCYGSTGPASRAPDGKPYGDRFPIVDVRDMVAAQFLALRRIGIDRLAYVIGGSLGGMQALAWAIDYPEIAAHAIVVGAHESHTALGIGLNYVARQAIALDPARPPTNGLRLARMIAMLSYKSEALLAERFDNRIDRKGGDPHTRKGDLFDVEGYLAYQGAIFEARMDAASYLVLTRAMDLFDVREEPVRAGQRIDLVGIESDWLFPAAAVEASAHRLAARGAAATYRAFVSHHGHDAFLADGADLAAVLQDLVPAPRS